MRGKKIARISSSAPSPVSFPTSLGTVWSLTRLDMIRMREENLSLSSFQGRVLFMSMFNHISWGRKNHEMVHLDDPTMVMNHAQEFTQSLWAFLGPGDGEKWYAACLHQPQGKRNATAEKMAGAFRQSGHPVFCCSYLSTCERCAQVQERL